MSIWLVKLGVVVLTGAAIAIASVPLLVLLDLLGEGTGYGLCPGGLAACDNPYTAGIALAVVLTVGFLAAVWGIRLLMRLARHMQSDDYQVMPRSQ